MHGNSNIKKKKPLILIGLFISEMFILIMGTEIFCKGFCFKNCNKCFSQSTKYIIIKANAICFGYKRMAIMRPELQDTKWVTSSCEKVTDLNICYKHVYSFIHSFTQYSV